MLYDPTRHEKLTNTAWNEGRARHAIEAIVQDTEARFLPDASWPLHPGDAKSPDQPPAHPLYMGSTGVIWALHYLEGVGAASLRRSYSACLEPLNRRVAEWIAGRDGVRSHSYLMGETPLLLMRYAITPGEAIAARLGGLMEAAMHDPARELMLGAPGTMLAASFMHERTGEARWAEHFLRASRQLWSQLIWSDEHQCHYWAQEAFGQPDSYMDSVHGFSATAAVLIRGRELLPPAEWAAWRDCIANSMQRSATWENDRVNWRPQLLLPVGRGNPMLMQFCHGSPGMVTCLAGLAHDALDPLLLAAGEATWDAGPLAKGANLCHGTGGNGYAFLKLHERTGDERWLDRARAFAMHGIEQVEAGAARAGQMHYSLWTGDLGFAIYLWDCLRAKGRFPTLDVFFP